MLGTFEPDIENDIFDLLQARSSKKPHLNSKDNLLNEVDLN